MKATSKGELNRIKIQPGNEEDISDGRKAGELHGIAKV